MVMDFRVVLSQNKSRKFYLSRDHGSRDLNKALPLAEPVLFTKQMTRASLFSFFCMLIVYFLNHSVLVFLNKFDFVITDIIGK